MSKLKQPKNEFYPKVTAMFPLFQKEAPANAKQLADALSASLRHVLEIARDPVVVQARTFPDLDEIAIYNVALSQATVTAHYNAG